MLLAENMGHFLKKFIEGNPGLIISFLSHFVQFLQISDLQNILIDQILEKVLRLLDELNMTVNEINLLKQLIIFDPIFYPFGFLAHINNTSSDIIQLVQTLKFFLQ